MKKPLLLAICTIVALGSAYGVYASVSPQVKAVPASVIVVPVVMVDPIGAELATRGVPTGYEIVAEDVTELAAAQATVTYDSSLFNFVEAVPGPEFDGCFSTVNDTVPGEVQMGLICPAGHTGAPLTLWVVTLEPILARPELEQEVSSQVAVTGVTLGNIDEQEIFGQGSSQSVTTTFMCGDVHPEGTGDMDDDILDALRKLKIAVGLVEPWPREQIAGDVHPDNESDPDGDGDIDILDALRDLKATVGLVDITSCGGPDNLGSIAEMLAGGPGAIYIGDLTQLVGPAPTPGQGGFDGNVPLDALERHLFLYESGYYQQLISEAKFTNPTELVSTGQTITIQHACINQALLPCQLMESFYAPNLLARTSGQVQLQVTSFSALGIPVTDILLRLADGTLNMAHVYGAYVAGQIPAIEVQNLWGIYPDTETAFRADSALIPDLEGIVLGGIGAGVVANHNWFAGNDQFLFCNTILASLADFTGKQTRSHSAALSDWITGMGAQAQFVAFSEVYSALELGILDCAVTGADPAFGQKWYEVTTHMNGPLPSFPSTNNVINQAVWDGIPADLQQILLEEGAKSELEALRLAAIQNEVGVQKNTNAGLQLVEFSAEIKTHSFDVALMQHVIPGWINRLGGPNAEIFQLFNEKVGPLVGLKINPDGSVEEIP